ncbi:MAG: hypothetical protein ABR529_09910 [Actinomycetota bacterium]
MARTWPFEGWGDPEEPFHSPEDFTRRQGAGVEAVIVRIGLGDAQLVLVDAHGRWERWVYASPDEARERAAGLGVPVHLGGYPEDLRVRINANVRPPEDFARAAYREQGRVGPVIPYPENRPRPPVRRADRPVAEEEEEDSEEFQKRHPGLSP